MIKFYTQKYILEKNINPKDVFVLKKTSWDDFGYETSFHLMYYDSNGNKNNIGLVKIAVFGIKEKNTQLDDEFFKLDRNRYYSLGQDVTYYENLKNFGLDTMQAVLSSLRDISYDESQYEKVNSSAWEMFGQYTKSITREVSSTSVKGEFRNIAQSKPAQTDFIFQYHFNNEDCEHEFKFSIKPKINPPQNISVIIGPNGVGKTYILKKMILTLLSGNKSKDSKNGYFLCEQGKLDIIFSKLLMVSFSPFDDLREYQSYITMDDDSEKPLKFKYIGLKDEKELGRNKTSEDLGKELHENVREIFRYGKQQRLLNAIERLEHSESWRELEYIKRIKSEEFDEDGDDSKLYLDLFNQMSSGHKLVLYAITSFVRFLEEKTLVIFEEPENFLHPPFLTSFFNAISYLFYERNALAIVATHSPLVLQEVPKKSVFQLSRVEGLLRIDEPSCETFGENFGIISREVFGLEVTKSGYQKILSDLVEKHQSYEKVIEALGNQVGQEGRAKIQILLRNYDQN